MTRPPIKRRSIYDKVMVLPYDVISSQYYDWIDEYTAYMLQTGKALSRDRVRHVLVMPPREFCGKACIVHSVEETKRGYFYRLRLVGKSKVLPFKANDFLIVSLSDISAKDACMFDLKEIRKCEIM